MDARIDSIQIGRVVSEGDPNSRQLARRYWRTGFYKKPVDHPVPLTLTGIAGDAVADTRHHGGPDKAILCYATAHYRRWAEDYPEVGMTGGAFGENLTVGGADESTVYVGDRFRIGDCQVQVSQPRQPCWKISRRWGNKTLTKQVAQNGRTGWYLRVIRGGMLQTGLELELIDRSNPTWPIARLNDVLFGREINRSATVELMGIAELAAAWKKDIA